MHYMLEDLDLDIRIATMQAVRRQVEAKLMHDSGVTYLADERLHRALTEELILLRAQQIDRMAVEVRRPA